MRDKVRTTVLLLLLMQEGRNPPLTNVMHHLKKATSSWTAEVVVGGWVCEENVELQYVHRKEENSLFILFL